MNLKQAFKILERNGVKVYPTYIKGGWYIQYELLKKVKTIPKQVTNKKTGKEVTKLINDAHTKTIIYLAKKIQKQFVYINYYSNLVLNY